MLFSFLTFSLRRLNLSIAFLKDGQMQLYKTLIYDRLAYLIVHADFFLFWVGQPHLLEVKGVYGLTKNPMKKIVVSTTEKITIGLKNHMLTVIGNQ